MVPEVLPKPRRERLVPGPPAAAAAGRSRLLYAAGAYSVSRANSAYAGGAAALLRTPGDAAAAGSYDCSRGPRGQAPAEPLASAGRLGRPPGRPGYDSPPRYSEPRCRRRLARLGSETSPGHDGCPGGRVVVLGRHPAAAAGVGEHGPYDPGSPGRMCVRGHRRRRPLRSQPEDGG